MNFFKEHSVLFKKIKSRGLAKGIKAYIYDLKTMKELGYF